MSAYPEGFINANEVKKQLQKCECINGAQYISTNHATHGIGWREYDGIAPWPMDWLDGGAPENPSELSRVY